MPVLDDLDHRLQRAAGPEPDTETALAAVLRRLDQQSHRPHRLLAAALILVLVGGAALAVRWGDGNDTIVRTDTSTTVTGSTALISTTTAMQTTEPVPFIDKPGYVPVVDHEGNLAGYMRDNPNLDPLPTFDLGTETPLSGGVVVDQNDVPTGYMIVGLGFVSNAQAADPATMKRLVAEHEARESEALEYREEHPDDYPGSRPRG